MFSERLFFTTGCHLGAQSARKDANREPKCMHREVFRAYLGVFFLYPSGVQARACLFVDFSPKANRTPAARSFKRRINKHVLTHTRVLPERSRNGHSSEVLDTF